MNFLHTLTHRWGSYGIQNNLNEFYKNHGQEVDYVCQDWHISSI